MGLTVPKIKTYSYGTPMAPVAAAPWEPALVGRGRRCNMLQEMIQGFNSPSRTRPRHDKEAGVGAGAAVEDRLIR